MSIKLIKLLIWFLKIQIDINSTLPASNSSRTKTIFFLKKRIKENWKINLKIKFSQVNVFSTKIFSCNEKDSHFTWNNSSNNINLTFLSTWTSEIDRQTNWIKYNHMSYEADDGTHVLVVFCVKECGNWNLFLYVVPSCYLYFP